MREVDHRAKNALTVVQATLRLTPKEDAQSYARAVEGRVRALARAHTLLAEEQWIGVELWALAEGELAPFLPGAGNANDADMPVAPRAELSGPPVRLRPEAAQAVAMALHELATNATKHGAISVPGGVVGLSWEADRETGWLRLRWEEIGGPVVPGPHWCGASAAACLRGQSGISSGAGRAAVGTRRPHLRARSAAHTRCARGVARPRVTQPEAQGHGMPRF
ncbi:HWE histidine kinase domain-containing protein [Siccirubricoccus deserti]